jgi:DNA-binding transcriptional ArsR family regulator
MHSDIASLHKILKDKTRQKIITLLNQKDSLSYTELLEATQAGSTGLLNYHLKIIGDLLVKNQDGQYQLSEKGKLAHKLIVEFPEVSNQAQKRRNQRLLIAILGVGQIVYLSILLVFYYMGQLDLYRLATSFTAFNFLAPQHRIHRNGRKE